MRVRIGSSFTTISTALLYLSSALHYSDAFVPSSLTTKTKSSTSSFIASRSRFVRPSLRNQPKPQQSHSQSGLNVPLYSTITEEDTDVATSDEVPKFNLTTALFCAGLAFDAYSEPSNSSRWEKDPQGLNVAFQSDSYTRTLYNGLLEVQPLKVTDLPNQDDTAEGMLSGSGMDAYLLVAIAEGNSKEDTQMLDKETYHAGVLDLKGSAHMGRSNTAWSNMRKEVALQNKAKGKSGSYHVKSTWTTGGKGVWEEDPPFYMYLQKPEKARVVFTVMDENVVGSDIMIGSSVRTLGDLIPNAARGGDPIQAAKESILEQLKKGEGGIKPEDLTNENIQKMVVQEWEGTLPLNIIPRKKDKGGQVATATVAGAMVAGPAGAAVGAVLGNLYEGMARGKLHVRMRYLPIPKSNTNRKKYEVKGGLPGVDWGELYKRHIAKLKEAHEGNNALVEQPIEETDEGKQEVELASSSSSFDPDMAGDDFELCVFVTHEKTGCSCAIYRSLEKKLLAVSFRGTCAPIDLITDASIVQTPWVSGVDEKEENIPRVHVGFRGSLESVSRRVKELILNAVPADESLSDYSLVITGHSLGGALATLFAADVAEFGMDAGRGLPQLEPSAPWWSRIGLFSNNREEEKVEEGPPRPKDIRVYSFGSPRVGNEEFVEKFDQFVKDGILKEAYRVVNGEDMVARLPRTVNALGVVRIGYEHSGSTALIALPKIVEGTETTVDILGNTNPLLWVEGESNNSQCPVRDGSQFTSPLADGSLLGDLVGAVKQVDTKDQSSLFDMASKFTDRMKNLKASDLAGVIGIDKNYVDREAKIFQSIFSGEAIGHHMEDQYYLGMGRASGFIALVGQEIQELDSLKRSLQEGEVVDIATLESSEA